jgi:hypothetical protein
MDENTIKSVICLTGAKRGNFIAAAKPSRYGEQTSKGRE